MKPRKKEKLSVKCMRAVVVILILLSTGIDCQAKELKAAQNLTSTKLQDTVLMYIFIRAIIIERRVPAAEKSCREKTGSKEAVVNCGKEIKNSEGE